MLKINKLIDDTIDNENFDINIKEFLKKSLVLQLLHNAKGGRWKLGREFDKLISEYTVKFERRRDEN